MKSSNEIRKNVVTTSVAGYTNAALMGRNAFRGGGSLSTSTVSDSIHPSSPTLTLPSEISTRETPPRKSVSRISAGGVLLRLVETPALDRI